MYQSVRDDNNMDGVESSISYECVVAKINIVAGVGLQEWWQWRIQLIVLELSTPQTNESESSHSIFYSMRSWYKLIDVQVLKLHQRTNR